jgi:hypothetical protein
MTMFCQTNRFGVASIAAFAMAGAVACGSSNGQCESCSPPGLGGSSSGSIVDTGTPPVDSGSEATALADGASEATTTADGGTGADADGGLEAGQGAACHGVLPACPAAANAPCTTGTCAPDSLPTGEACSVPACGMLIDPCPGADLYLPDRVDSYGCTCDGGHWRCALCELGQGVCAESDAATDAGATP